MLIRATLKSDIEDAKRVDDCFKYITNDETMEVY